MTTFSAIPKPLTGSSRGEISATARSIPAPLSIVQRLGKRAVCAAFSGVSGGMIRLHERGGSLELGDARTPASKRIDVVVHDPAFYERALLGGSVGIGLAYMDGSWSASDMPGLIELLARNADRTASLGGPARFVRRPIARVASWFDRNTRRGARRNIAAHYDLSNELFALFLDPSMTYSCAIFPREGATLGEAQHEKIDRVCRKLQLAPEHHVVEIGTGWGSMALHAAARYGCRVTTATISREQFTLATRRVEAAGLCDRVRVVLQDYRDLRGSFDRLITIEMIEAVGRDHLDGYFRACSRLLTPSGAALIQAITIREDRDEAAVRDRDFIKQCVFPGSCLLSMRAMMTSVSRGTDLTLTHTEELGSHYARTLALWRERFHANIARVRELGFDDRFQRMWDYYLAYCEGGFRARRIGVAQLMLTKPGFVGVTPGNVL